MGLGIIDIIRHVETPVHTIVTGDAMSMALWIFLHGDKRFVGKYSTLMYHQVSSYNYGKIEGLELDLKESKRLQAMLQEDIINKSSIKKEQLEDYNKRKAEWYISAQQALKLKLADEII